MNLAHRLYGAFKTMGRRAALLALAAMTGLVLPAACAAVGTGAAAGKGTGSTIGTVPGATVGTGTGTTAGTGIGAAVGARVAGAGGEGTVAAQAWVEPGSVDPAVPTPDSIIGYPLGERAVRYDTLVRYLSALDAASPHVSVSEYGRTHEGRGLYYVTITSERNHARLAQIQADAARLADPRKLAGDDEANRILDELPGIAWMAYSIHGDELSSTDAAVQLAYQLAAGTDDATRRLRDELVIHIDPLMNPDGRERYLSQLQQLQGKAPVSDYQALQHGGLWSAGRGNHYLFDLNRDWLTMSQPETRGRAAVILSWNPHLVVDSHEMSGLDTYLFDPPREPINPNLSPSVFEWRRRFSADQAAEFDRHGWSYYTQEWYEEWYPGYTNSWTSLLGAVGLLYEQAGVDSAQVKQPAGTLLTFRESVHHHLASSLANLTTLRANRRAILEDFLADRRAAVDPGAPEPRVFLMPPGEDERRFRLFVEMLGRHGIEFGFAASEFDAVGKVEDTFGGRAEATRLPAGTLVVRSDQPHRRLLHAILDFDPRLTDEFLKVEREHLENHQESQLYDVTAWNPAMAFGLTAYWADRANVEVVAATPPGTKPAESASEDPLTLPSPPRGERGLGTPPRGERGFGTHSERPGPAEPPGPHAYGYVIDGNDGDVYALLVRLMEHGCKPRVAEKPFTIAGRSFDRGAVVLRNHENPADLPGILKACADGLHVDVIPVDTALSQDGPDLGGQRFRLLAQPRVAVATQWPVSTTSFGSIWYLLDAVVGMAVSPVNVQYLSGIDLRKYNVLIIPDAGVGGLEAVLGPSGVEHVRTWVEGGGTLIAVGEAAAFVASKDRGLSNVALKQDVLDQDKAYAEALSREKSARQVKVDPADVWRGRAPGGASAAASAAPAPAPAGEASPSPTSTASENPLTLPSPPRGERGPTTQSSPVPASAAPASAAPASAAPASAAPPPGPAPTPASAPEKNGEGVAATPAGEQGGQGGQGEPAAPGAAAQSEAGTVSQTGAPADSEADLEAAQRRDEWGRTFSPSGAFAAAHLNPQHWLTFGLDDPLPVLLAGPWAFMSKDPVRTPVRLMGEDGLRVSGLIWPEARRRWADTAWATTESVGHGQIILLAADPYFRGYLEGTGRLLLNAVILGPGLGADAPLPW